MQLILKNIGPFQKAILDIGDVTIIAGINDTGKSYLSRLLFTMIKIATNDVEIQVVKNFFTFIKNTYQEIMIIINNFSVFNFNDKEKTTSLFKLIATTTKEINNINKCFIQNWTNKFDYKKENFNDFWKQLLVDYQELLTQNDKLLANMLLEIELDTNKDAYKIKTIKYTINMIKKDISEMLELFIKEGKDVISTLIRNILTDNFYGESLKNKNSLTVDSYLKFNLTEEKNLTITIKKNNKIVLTNNFNYWENINDNKLLDVTYISDTESILDVMLKQNHNYKKLNYMLENERLKLVITNIFKFENYNYIVDFKTKINNINKDEQYCNLKTVLLKVKVTEKFATYFANDSKFNFENSILTTNGITVKLANASRGLKIIESFKVMIKNNFFQPGTLVIIDEPEAYIHPEWQYLFTRALLDIANIVKFKLVISTHSPYIIETITSLAKHDFKKLNFVYNFINKDKNGNSCIIKKDSLEHINETLSYPYRELDKCEFDWEFKK